MFSHTTTIRLHDTDAAGVLYFAHQFRIAHEAFEAYLQSVQFDIGNLLRTADYRVPIVHAEADYRAPLSVGDRVMIQLAVERIGDTSFTLVYRLVKQDGTQAGVVRTVHVSVDKESGQKRLLPDLLRTIVEGLK